MRVPGGHEARATSAQGKTHRERDAPMTTIDKLVNIVQGTSAKVEEANK